jgi:hypothetical protein
VHDDLVSLGETIAGKHEVGGATGAALAGASAAVGEAEAFTAAADGAQESLASATLGCGAAIVVLLVDRSSSA